MVNQVCALHYMVADVGGSSKAQICGNHSVKLFLCTHTYIECFQLLIH